MPRSSAPGGVGWQEKRDPVDGRWYLAAVFYLPVPGGDAGLAKSTARAGPITCVGGVNDGNMHSKSGKVQGVVGVPGASPLHYALCMQHLLESRAGLRDPGLVTCCRSPPARMPQVALLCDGETGCEKHPAKENPHNLSSTGNQGTAGELEIRNSGPIIIRPSGFNTTISSVENETAT